MEILFIILYVVFWLTIFDVVYFVLGYALSAIPYQKSSFLHRLGVRLLAMSFFTSAKFVSKRCQQPCETTKCGNWTCSLYSKPRNGDKKPKFPDPK